MKKNPFLKTPSILAIAAGSLIAGMVLTFGFEAFAFVGPAQAPPSGYGAIGSDASNNVAVGTSATISGTKFLDLGATSDNTTYNGKFLENNTTPILLIRDDGALSIATSTVIAGDTIIGDNLIVGGTITAPSLGGSTISAGNVSAGTFGQNTFGGNYSFPATVSLGTGGTGVLNLPGGGDGTNPPLHFGSNAPAGFNPGGNIGIWLASNGAINVNANVSSTGLCLGGVCNTTWPATTTSQWTTSGSNIYYSGGNVGIGTASPSSMLTVNGQMSATSYCISGANCISAWPSGGSGTVTSITAGSGLSGGAITTSGTISLNVGNANTWTANQTFTSAPNTSWVGSVTASGQGGTVGYLAGQESGQYWTGVAGQASVSNGVGVYGLATNAAGIGGYFTNSGGGYALITGSGNVGIRTASPAYPLQVNGVIAANTSASNSVSVGTTVAANDTYQVIGGIGYWGIRQDTSNGFNVDMYNAGSPINVLHINSTGNVGIGTSGPTSKLTIGGSGSGVVDLAVNGRIQTGDGNNNGGVWVNNGDTEFLGNDAGLIGLFNSGWGLTLSSSGTVAIGGKLTVGTIDPVYAIGGQNYATYNPAMTGEKEETTGLLNLTCAKGGGANACSTTIDFNALAQGSDLWLFGKATSLPANLDNLIVILTPSFDGKTWYNKDMAKGAMTIYGDQAGEVSYRFSAPRFDASQWPNTAPAGEAPNFTVK